MILRALVSLLACVPFLCSPYSTARSAELKVFASRAISTVLEVVGPEFEKSSGHKLHVIRRPDAHRAGRTKVA
jgi:ABC-type molybdate transport system substrate-binding protein